VKPLLQRECRRENGQHHPPLSLDLIETAARALADAEKRPLTERVVQDYRDDAQVVVVAVLARLGGKKGEPGLFSFAST
jgi:hypothetical protein